MFEPLKRLFVESFAGIIALGLLFAPGIMHFASIFTVPGGTWMTASEYCGVTGAQGNDECSSNQAALEKFLMAQPAECEGDGDCDGYYIRADSCARAVVLRKPGISKALEPQLLKLQEKVRAACTKSWSQRPACEPLPFKASCRQARCVDAITESLRQQPWTSASQSRQSSPENYGHAVLRRECAPWDGPAIAIFLTKSNVPSREVPFPMLRVSLWRRLPPPLNQPIPLDGKFGVASRCLRPQHCEAAIAGVISLTSYTEGVGAVGTYELKFKNDEVERGSFRADWQNYEVTCG